MPFLHQQGALEPLEVLEGMEEVRDQINYGAQNSLEFIVFMDTANEPVIVQIRSIYRITEHI